MKTAPILLLFRVLSATLLLPATAPEAEAEATVNFHGTLIAATCAADAIDVDFGDVALNAVKEGTIVETRSVVTPRAATGSSTKIFTMNVACKGELSDGIQYRFDSAPATFNGYAIPTSVTGLGVIVANIASGGNANQLVPQTWYTLSGAGTYNMMAILVRDPSATFSGGDFSATTTLTMQLP